MPDTDENLSLPPVNLLANSYDFQALLAASDHAASLKTEGGKQNAVSKIATDLAINQDVIKGFAAPALPEGTVIDEVESADGNIVEVPVTDPSLNDEAAASSQTPEAGEAEAAEPASRSARR